MAPQSLIWTHPTGRAPKTVALVCLGPSRNTYVNACLLNDLDEAVTQTDEIWTLNRGATLFRHDLLFVMDHIQGEADKFPRYGAALWKHDKPIITSDNCEDWPAHVHRYPFKLIWNWLARTLTPMHGDWWHNSLAYILCYAGFIGVRELRVFGADYTNHHNGVVEDGHPCVAYWTGKLESAGLLVQPAADSNFLNAAQRHWLYGYRHDPRTYPGNRARFQSLTGQTADADATDLLSGERQVAPTLDAIQPDHRYRYAWAAEQVEGRVLDCGGGIGYGSRLLAEVPAVTQVTLYERSAEALAYAAQHYDHPNVRRYQVDLSEPFLTVAQETPADCAVAFEIIEHLPDPRPFLRSLPARRLLASVPNEAVVPYSPEAAPFHHRHYTRQQFHDLLTECGWTVTGWHGQTDPASPVRPDTDNARTLVVSALRSPVT